jgi:ABC-2 type transport system ATP-binding protein
MPLIEAFHLQRNFGATQAVRNVSLQVSAGEIYGLVGPDGAGKTTTIRLLCGVLKPGAIPGISSLIRIAGLDIFHQTELARRNIGYLPQRFSLYEELSVLENIRFFAEARGLPAAEWQPRCMEILNFVGLSEFIDRRAGFLSGGMKQKLGLAAALVHRPRVLLLDEPTTGVDPVTRQDFWQLIIRLVGKESQLEQTDSASAEQSGTAVLISTPYMDEAARCTRIGFMSEGQMIREGTPSQIRSVLDGRVLELTGRPLPLIRKLARADPDVEDVQMFGDRLHLRVRSGQADQVSERLQENLSAVGCQLDRLRSVPPQLEDVFMSLLSEAHAAVQP